jgi:hypothetical protein
VSPRNVPLFVAIFIYAGFMTLIGKPLIIREPSKPMS